MTSTRILKRLSAHPGPPLDIPWVCASEALSKPRLDKSKKSKTLYHVKDVAAIHSQKIGNASRTIDTWYEGAEEFGPIAVEPYGSVTTQEKAYRPPRKRDFYTLLDDWMLRNKPSTEQQHFLIAVLIRGGVCGAAS
ncbi:type I-F CRISPR-associated protein Cas7f/Csy3 [Caballeronia sp. EK]|uniref:type I-F CRISPR-associated protein Cas7f/Csy3 n=1 Tax=Caballeronia sp. EK TaxID=2767469 RepID=UPI00165567A6|nr:type I-F CRISPR-associated protein Cas7f/Csy3 [Caballeronia sp. EK]MBC8637771.1 type I-F CRISPR-associated protein Cas7f/Csy3 [Caballeronia sp. EK]